MAFSSGEGIATVQYETDTYSSYCCFVSFMHNSEVCKERNHFSLNRQADPMKQQTADISTGKTCWLNRSCESILKKSYVGRV